MGAVIRNGKRGSVGRPGVSDDVWNVAVRMVKAGKPPRDIAEATGLGLTKVYEVKRNPVFRGAVTE